MNSWIIAIAILAVVVIAALLVRCIRYIKRKIRNRIIDIATDVITEAAGKYLGEKTAGKVNRVASIAAETIKEGNAMKAVAKKPAKLRVLMDLAEQNKNGKGE